MTEQVVLMQVNYLPRKYIKSPIESRSISLDDLPIECRTDGTLCGSFLTSTGPCRRGLRGCPLRHLPEYRLVEVQA